MANNLYRIEVVAHNNLPEIDTLGMLLTNEGVAHVKLHKVRINATTQKEKEANVDAVEVVRCKECKWYNRNEDIMPQSGSCEFHEMVKMDWDFCSRAKMDGDGNG